MSSLSLLIYVPKTTNRVRYAFKLIFKDILGLDLVFTNSTEEYLASAAPKINYSTKPMEPGELFFAASSILFETGITEQEINVFEFDNNKAFFATVKNSALPFDPFAMGFYLASRYEEYLPHLRDLYNRFDAKESLAYRSGFLVKPLVNIWAGKVKQLVQVKFPGLSFPIKKYYFTPTIDIDNAFAYKEKGMVRNIGGYLRAIYKLNFKDIWQRTLVLLNFRKDPFDTYEYQLAIQEKYKLEPVYFFLLGDYGLNDKNVNVQSRKFQALIKSIADYAKVGIHPSFGSNMNTLKLKKEVERLSKILNRDITKSRQHFLKLNLPQTYRNLVALDIKEDYTMGYASHIGFRASMCTPFYFYDLDIETESPLKIYPFAVMEGTLKDYMKISSERAMSFIEPLINQVKSVNGNFISLWHNESMNDLGQWKGWRNVYEQLIEQAIKK